MQQLTERHLIFPGDVRNACEIDVCPDGCSSDLQAIRITVQHNTYLGLPVSSNYCTQAVRYRIKTVKDRGERHQKSREYRGSQEVGVGSDG